MTNMHGSTTIRTVRPEKASSLTICCQGMHTLLPQIKSHSPAPAPLLSVRMLFRAGALHPSGSGRLPRIAWFSLANSPEGQSVRALVFLSIRFVYSVVQEVLYKLYTTWNLKHTKHDREWAAVRSVPCYVSTQPALTSRFATVCICRGASVTGELG